MCCYLRLKNNAPYICRVVFRSQSTKLKKCGGNSALFYSFSPIVCIYIKVEVVLRVYKRPYIGKEQDFLPVFAIFVSRLATQTLIPRANNM